MNGYPQASGNLPTEFLTEKPTLSTGYPHEKYAQTRRILFVRTRALSFFEIGLRMGLVRAPIFCARPEHDRLFGKSSPAEFLYIRFLKRLKSCAESVV